MSVMKGCSSVASTFENSYSVCFIPVQCSVMQYRVFLHCFSPHFSLCSCFQSGICICEICICIWEICICTLQCSLCSCFQRGASSLLVEVVAFVFVRVVFLFVFGRFVFEHCTAVVFKAVHHHCLSGLLPIICTISQSLVSALIHSGRADNTV